MNAERLLEVYEQISEAPDAIARLRRFVLDLAVRGKLVLQDEGDEPASSLLERIEQRKSEILKETGMRKPRKVAAMDPAEIWAALPSNWAWTQISKLGLISPRNEADDGAEASFVPMPMVFAEYGVANKHEPRTWGEIKKGYTHFAEGDVGLAKITPCFENGKSTVFRNLTGGFGSGTTELHILRPILVDPDYVVLFLKSPQFIETGITKMTGTAGQKRVPSEYFASSPFPLPPLAEQHRIVAKVDDLMALCDRLEEARKTREETRDKLTAASLARLTAPDTTPEDFPTHAAFALEALPALTTRPDQIKTLRQTILNLAVRGKLVKQDPADELPSKSLDAINAMRDAMVKAKEIRREKSLAPIQLDDTPFFLPSTWKWVRVGDLALFTQYGTSAKAAVSDTGVPVLTMGNIHEGRVVRKNEKRIPETSDELPSLFLRNLDLLYNRTNSAELVGKTGIFTGKDDSLSFASYLIRVRLHVEVTSPHFVNLAMNAPVFRETQIVPHIKKQTGQANVSGSALKNMLIPLPPLAEQHRIVAKVDALMVLCDRLEEALTTADTTRTRLLETLLHEALAPEVEPVSEAAE